MRPSDFARRWKFAQAGTSVEPALADPLVQLALITSPSPLHSEQAVQALQAGKDVIVEIPVALSWPEAQNVAQVAAALGRRVWVCHTLRSTAALREVRERVQAGRLHVTQIAGFFGIPRRRNQGMGGIGTRSWIDNLLWHHGCHQVDAVAVGARHARRAARAGALRAGPSDAGHGARRGSADDRSRRRADHARP